MTLSELPEPLPQLTERQEMLLSLIVREYIRDPQPVASKSLVQQFRLNISSATVRNEMAVLEEKGLVYAPHTSAGRVPTSQGYRYFVHRLLTGSDLLPQERRKIAREFRQAPLNVDEWMRVAAVILSRTAQTAALITRPRAAESQFKHLELIVHSAAHQQRLRIIKRRSGAEQDPCYVRCVIARGGRSCRGCNATDRSTKLTRRLPFWAERKFTDLQ
jgi:heat shock gene repressor HrcA